MKKLLTHSLTHSLTDFT